MRTSTGNNSTACRSRPGSHHGYKVCDTLHQRLLLPDLLPEVPGSLGIAVSFALRVTQSIILLLHCRRCAPRSRSDRPIERPSGLPGHTNGQLLCHSGSLGCTMRKPNLRQWPWDVADCPRAGAGAAASHIQSKGCARPIRTAFGNLAVEL